MSPARSWRFASHDAGLHDWLPNKTGGLGLRRGRIMWIQFAQSLLTVAHQPRTGCIRLVLWSCIFSYIGCVSVSSCRFLSCVHHVAVVNDAFCMTCSLLMLVQDARGILQSQSHNCVVGSHECLLLFTPSCCSECFYDL